MAGARPMTFGALALLRPPGPVVADLLRADPAAVRAAVAAAGGAWVLAGVVPVGDPSEVSRARQRVRHTLVTQAVGRGGRTTYARRPFEVLMRTAGGRLTVYARFAGD